MANQSLAVHPNDLDSILEDGIVYNITRTTLGQFWFHNGNLHRVKGPAVEYADGRNVWWHNGKMHRLDGPAVDYPNEKTWYYNGEKVECSSQTEFERLLRLKAFW